MAEQGTNISVRVIQTLSQSFLEANIESFCHLITGINPVNNKNISISFIESGGFVYTNHQVLKTTSGHVFKNKEDFFAKMADFYSKKNQLISQSLKNKNIDLPFPFFPIQYMKPLSAWPNFGSGKFSKSIVSWTGVYKVEIPAFENPQSQQMEYANLQNGGIEITVGSTGQINNLRYNLLPLEARKNVPLFKILENENDVPQLAYLLNKQTNRVAPFYLSVTAQGYIPATKESILPPFLDGKKVKFINPVGFDENRVVVWIQKIGLNKKLKIKDASSSEKDTNESMALPVGAKVIRLKPKNEHDLNTPCLFWWQGSYHQSDIPERNLGINNVVISNFSSQVLQNDIEHLLNRVESSIGKNIQFDSVIDFVKKRKNTVLNKSKIQDALTLYRQRTFIDEQNPLETINRLLGLIKDAYDPEQGGIVWSESVLIVPFNEQWFKKDEILTKWFEALWKGGRAWGEDIHYGGSGAYYDDYRVKEVLDDLMSLKEIVSISSQNYTPEGVWLQSISQSYLDKIKRIVIIGDVVWKFGKNTPYAEFIGINMHFSIFSVPPLLSVITHEFSQGDSFFYGNVHFDEPHIMPQDTESTWESLSSSPLNNEILDNRERINELYQENDIYSCLNLAILLRIIESL
jgi:hypothetical protein